ncbi:hypothetical protein ACVWWN_003757 [Mycobacterium sp. URHB0021]
MIDGEARRNEDRSAPTAELPCAHAVLKSPVGDAGRSGRLDQNGCNVAGYFFAALVTISSAIVAASSLMS